jgi:hypothetical protein
MRDRQSIDHERFIFDDTVDFPPRRKIGGWRRAMSGSMRTPAPEALTRETPLRLETAARLAFPDGSMSAAALRRMIVSGKLEAEFIAGRYYVTIAAIEGMRARCRVKARDHISNSRNTPTGKSCGSSVTTEGSEHILAQHKPEEAIRKGDPNQAKIADILSLEMRRLAAFKCGLVLSCPTHRRRVSVGAGDICGAALMPTVGRGYVDLNRGIFKRKPDNKKETSKRQPTVPIPLACSHICAAGSGSASADIR